MLRPIVPREVGAVTTSVAGELGVGFLDCDAAGQVHVEEMDFAIDGQPLAVGSEEGRGVVAFALAGCVLGDRTGEQMDFELARQSGHQGEGRSVEGFGGGGLVGDVCRAN